MADKRFDVDAQPIIETPRRMHPVENAVMSCVASGIAGLLIAFLLERPFDEVWRWIVVGMLLPLAIFLLATLAPIVVWALENAARRDFTRDGVIGKPHPVLVNPRQGQQAAAQQVEAEYRANFERFIRGCERSTSLRSWERRGLSRAEYDQFRDALIGAGYAAWNGPKREQGWRLLVDAESAIQGVRDA